MQKGFGEAIDKEVLDLIDEGYSATKIRQKLGMTKHGLASRVRRMRDRGVEVPYLSRAWSLTPEAPDSSFFRYCDTVERDQKKAAEKHLADLKEHHNPSRTEYRITTERPCAPRSYPVYGSIYGSPALSCANS